ncbi:hypothetical protein C8R41DRAFT_636021 [Lentinula lateritia]|uniref:Secreted protein n=1 Tax=Lentinula lateritia TaxID=40482 RepID=A0ABQ8V3G8_9AGAR|nr:hypothetical protein C8R41DRAFT_636021 [Lentinula lateritia]
MWASGSRSWLHPVSVLQVFSVQWFLLLCFSPYLPYLGISIPNMNNYNVCQVLPIAYHSGVYHAVSFLPYMEQFCAPTREHWEHEERRLVVIDSGQNHRHHN